MIAYTVGVNKVFFKMKLYVLFALIGLLGFGQADHQDVLNNDLFAASKSGNLNDVIKAIENGADLKATDRDGKTALFWSSREGHLEITKYLVEHGADVNARDWHKSTALIWSSGTGQLESVKYLVEHGADVNADSGAWHDQYTPLIASVYDGNLEIVKYLVEHGADVGVIVNEEGDKAVNIAHRKGYKNVADFLANIGHEDYENEEE